MSLRYHINKHGIPAPCTAKSGKCPLGGAGEHFKTEKQAQDYVDNLGEQKHGLLPGSNLQETEQLKQLDDFNERMSNNMFDNFTYESNDNNFEYIEMKTNPNDLADKYFESLIKEVETGVRFNRDEYNYDWENEVQENKDAYITNNGGGDETWTDESDENMDADIYNAVKIGLYYDGQIHFADHVFNKAHEVDWSIHGKTEKQGVVDALKYVYDKKWYR